MTVLIALSVMFLSAIWLAVLVPLPVRSPDPDLLRELRSRYKVQTQLEKGMSPESRAVLDRILWDEYRDT